MADIVYVVGLGPGDPQFLTAQAQSALEEAEVLCGYPVYLDLVRPYYPEKEYYATGMTKELDRCRWALETAHSGPEDLTTGSYGIEEPTGELFTDYAAIDFVAVPGVAFDNAGNRLGRGKGYYDRLLPRLTAFKAGICFPFQLVKEVPAEPFDIRMDIIITINEDELSHPYHPLPSCDRE